jgi:hypothetical protein
MVGDATAETTARLLVGAVNYDYFLAECSQAVAVDPIASAQALTRLIEDKALRSRMGAAGRERVLERFAWERIIPAYEALWAGQDAERAERLVASASGPLHVGRGPAYYPAPEISFAAYPTHLLTESDRLETVPGAGLELVRLMSVPLTNYMNERRSNDPSVIRSVLLACRTPTSIAELDELLFHGGVAPGAGRATLAWMMKYGLLRRAEDKGRK